MSRSRRHTPISGNTTAQSDGKWKAKAARVLRHRVKQHLSVTLDADPFSGRRWDTASPRDAPKHGKSWLKNRSTKWVRK